jgi:hypothetical protein
MSIASEQEHAYRMCEAAGLPDGEARHVVRACAKGLLRCHKWDWFVTGVNGGTLPRDPVAYLATAVAYAVTEWADKGAVQAALFGVKAATKVMFQDANITRFDRDLRVKGEPTDMQHDDRQWPDYQEEGVKEVDERAKVEWVMGRIKDKYDSRMAVAFLLYLEGFTFQEMGDYLNESPSTVRYWIRVMVPALFEREELT